MLELFSREIELKTDQIFIWMSKYKLIKLDDRTKAKLQTQLNKNEEKCQQASGKN